MLRSVPTLFTSRWFRIWLVDSVGEIASHFGDSAGLAGRSLHVRPTLGCWYSPGTSPWGLIASVGELTVDELSWPLSIKFTLQKFSSWWVSEVVSDSDGGLILCTDAISL